MLAFLLCEGFNVENDYQNKLDELFLENPENDIYLELELMSSNIKNSILYIISQFDKWKIDYELFGKHLMKRSEVCYNSMDIKLFDKKCIHYGTSF